MTKLQKLITQKEIIEGELQCYVDGSDTDAIAEFDTFSMRINFHHVNLTPREMEIVVEWYNQLMTKIEPINMKELAAEV